MALSKTSMADKIEAQLALISLSQGEGAGGESTADTNRRAHLEAFCQGVIDEIKANMTVVNGGNHCGHDTGCINHSHPPGEFS